MRDYEERNKRKGGTRINSPVNTVNNLWPNSTFTSAFNSIDARHTKTSYLWSRIVKGVPK